MTTSIVLFERDLRVRDHEGLTRAAELGPVIPLVIFRDRFRTRAPEIPNRARFLIESLDDLNEQLTDRGAPLVIRCGDRDAILREYNADHVFSADHYAAVAPGTVTPVGGERYKVFTPYWNRWQQVPLGSSLPAPERIDGVSGLESDSIDWLRAIEPTATDLAAGGEQAAHAALAEVPLRIGHYADGGHDDLAADRTTRISPYLHFGNVSARQVAEGVEAMGVDGDAVVRQLCWRDFFIQYEAFEPHWPVPAIRPPHLDAWEEGRTGYPLVDAGMRQLVREGWMHNRARMVTASFLTKDLQIDWPFGADFFMRHLVDADVDQNNGNWKWVAGVGTDTRPDRAFNPLRQQQRFDKRAEYIRRYVPEYGTADYPDPIIPEDELASARARRRF